MCTRHGCAYNIENGQSEHVAHDDLAKFYVEEKKGEVSLFIPQYIPTMVRALDGVRDYNDLRKVVIVGTGPAVYKAC